MDDEQELDAIWAEHRGATADRLETLRRVAAAADAGDLADGLRATGIAEAHTLGGAASIFGFADGARLAREVEQGLREGGHGRLSGLVEALARALDRDRHARGTGG